MFFLFFSFLFVCVFYKKKENSFFWRESNGVDHPTVIGDRIPELLYISIHFEEQMR